MTELKPCPFCGEKDDIDYGIMSGTMKGFDYIQCQNCGAEIRSINNGKFIEAIELWNRRAESLKEQTAADVTEVRRGEWIYGEFDIPHCSECGKKVLPNQISNYCPNCGAKMEGKAGDEE